MKENLGRYKIIKEIGRGAMGVVYQGYDPKIERVVALKTIRKDRLAESKDVEELITRFQREVRATGKLVHPNVITVYDTGEDEEAAYIAMEFLEGETLDSLIQKGVRWPLEKVVDIIVQICEGLDFTHREGVVHRDLKPSNIMLVRGDQVKITDFGISKAVGAASSPLTQEGVLLGTPSYMSPEQIAGTTIDGRSDLFSLGIILYQLLTGEKAFSGDTIPNLLYTIVHENPPPPTQINPSVPPLFDQVVAKALAKNPEDRYRTANDFAEDAKRAYRGEQLKASLPTDVTAAITTGVSEGIATARRKYGILTGIVVLALALGLLTTYWVRRPFVPSRQEGGIIQPVEETSGESVEGETGIPPVLPEQKRQAPETLAPVATLVIKSTPPDAVVFLNDNRFSGLTPALIERVPAGEPHTIRIEKKGYKPWSQTVEPESDQSLTLEASLTRMLSTLVVRSTPPGASVFVDGKELESPTPALIEKVPAGEPHTIRIEKRGYKPWSQTVEPESDQSLTLEASLTRMLSTLVVRSTPPGASVFVDGKPVSGSTPVELTGLSAGETYEIEVTKDAYQTVTHTVKLAPDEKHKDLQISLKPVAGQIRIASAPKGAKVYVNGRYTGYQTPTDLYDLRPGTYTLELKKEGCKAWKHQVTIQPSETLELPDIRLEPALGRLNLLASPWAEVYHRGKKLGTTPLANIRFLEGSHKLVLKNPVLNVEKEITVRILAGQLTTEHVDMTRGITGRLKITVTPWAHVYIDGKPAGTTPLRPLELAPGAHEVRLENDTLKVKRSFTVMIKPNETLSREVNLLKPE
jgi:tRNA A-37 threonylcarbamoyl transferase component Bud32